MMDTGYPIRRKSHGLARMEWAVQVACFSVLTMVACKDPEGEAQAPASQEVAAPESSSTPQVPGPRDWGSIGLGDTNFLVLDHWQPPTLDSAQSLRMEEILQTGMGAPDSEKQDPAADIYYFTNSTFMDGWNQGTEPSLLSCRGKLARMFLPTLLARGVSQVRFAWALSGDSLLQAAGCAEFSPDRSIYGLFKIEPFDRAEWKRVELAFILAVTLRAGDCDGERKVVMELIPFAVPRGSRQQPVIYARTNRALEGTLVPYQKVQDPEIRIPRRDTAYPTVWVSQFIEDIGMPWPGSIYKETEFAWRSSDDSVPGPVERSMRLTFRHQDSLIMVIAERKAQGGYLFNYADIGVMAFTDLDNNGEPEFILKFDDLSQVIVPISGKQPGPPIFLHAGEEPLESGC